MYTKVYSFDLAGIDTRLIEIEVSIRQGLSQFSIIGLGDRAINEARERIICAVRSAELNYYPKHMVVNLAPACVAKAGTHLDLPIAVGYLAASGQIKSPHPSLAFIGELNLNGEIRPVSFLRSLLLDLDASRIKKVYVPRENFQHLEVPAATLEIVPVADLKELVSLLKGKRAAHSTIPNDLSEVSEAKYEELAHIQGNYLAKRALTLAAVGGHNMLFRGVAGVGKSMLARALIGILPPLSSQNHAILTKIYETSGQLKHFQLLPSTPPLRAPHSATTVQGMIGGGSMPRPGEASLAHSGVLLLDEAPQFSRQVIDSLRQPLDEGIIQMVRQKSRVVFPAQFQLVMTMNPCPCGNLGAEGKRCTCNVQQLNAYRNKIATPILDRTDIGVQIFKADLNTGNSKKTPTSAEVKAKVLHAREFANAGRKQKKANAWLDAHQLDASRGIIDSGIKIYAKESLVKLNLSWRRYHHTMRLALTIADFELRQIERNDIDEALALQMGLLNYAEGG
jgi:magnesium chelatase family protein